MGAPPVLRDNVTTYTDPLPQALGADGDRDLLRHDGRGGDDRVWALSSALTMTMWMINPTSPQQAGGCSMTHWLIAPVVLPAMLAPFIVLAARYHIGIQRVFSIAGVLMLIAISAGLALASR